MLLLSYSSGTHRSRTSSAFRTVVATRSTLAAKCSSFVQELLLYSCFSLSRPSGMMPWEVRELGPRWKVKVTKQTEADTEVEEAKEN